jgi:hypothetical protein
MRSSWFIDSCLLEVDSGFAHSKSMRLGKQSEMEFSTAGTCY